MATNSQPAVGIAGVQAAARSSGTATRTGSKKFFLLAIKWAPLVGLLLALAFLWKDYASKTPQEKGDAPTATTSTQATRQEAKWERLADGSIPVGVWSVPITAFPGCEVRYASGCGKVYKAQARNRGGEWSELQCGTMPDLDETRVMMLVPGATSLPVRNICS